MQPEQEPSKGMGNDSGSIVCAQCGSPMPHGMRFCRACGNRLGEGPAEYTETVRFADAKSASDARFTAPYGPDMTARMAPMVGTGFPRKRRLGFSGMTWMWIALGLFFALGGGLSVLKRSGRVPTRISAPVVRQSYFGVERFKTVNGGVTFDAVTPPDGPADKAGLVGGDVVTSFDGQVIKDEDQIMDLLSKTPIGKEVDLTYVRDGAGHTTQMVTISKDEYDRLNAAYRNRPEGRGLFGFDDDSTTVVNDAATKTFGVRLDGVERNGPAELFGIREGDIITEFDKVPIRTTGELLSRVRRAIPGSKVEVTLLRNGELMKLFVTMGRTR
jgi:membrane-associated protease RseP (regulator of RpoE activity)